MLLHRLNRASSLSPILAAMLVLAGGGGDSASNFNATPSTVPAPVAPSNQMVVTAAQMNDKDMSKILLRLKAGDTLILPAGKFKFDGPLMMNIDGATILGQGRGTDSSLPGTTR